MAWLSAFAALQIFDDFTPKRVLNSPVHILEGLVFLLDVLFDCIRIFLD
jgi:hypothetical protein